jgi:hypothetical protein
MANPVGGVAVKSVLAIVPTGASLAGAVDIGGSALCAIQTPSDIDSATELTFSVSYDGSTYANLYDDGGTEYSVTAAASRSIVLNPTDFWGVRYVKVRLGDAGSPTTATAARTLTLSLRP